MRQWWLVAPLVAACVMAAPALPKRPQPEATQPEEVEFSPEDELEYSRYLKEVVQVLEQDPDFKKKLEAATPEEIKTGNIADELDFVHHSVRSKLSEIKRREGERLMELRSQLNTGRAQHRPLHLDLHRTNFTKDDLRKLIRKTVADLDAIDVARRKQFKEYELQKEFEYKRKLAGMTPEDRAKAEAEHEAEVAKHKQHPKLHQPGHKAQLEEVWEEEDHMKGEEFDPKAFFALHDTNGDGVWDSEEVEALFLHELRKMYNESAHEDDMREKEEEMERMREQVDREMDTNNDSFISLEEFVAFTHKQAYEEDQGYQGLDEQTLFEQDEYERFQRERIEQLRAQGIHVPDMAMPLPDHQYQAVHPDQVHPNQVYPNQVYPNQVYPNQVYPNQVHPNQVYPNQVHPNQVYQNQMPAMHQNQQMNQQVYHDQVPQMQGGQLNQQQMGGGQQQIPSGYQQVPAGHQQVPAGHQQVPAGHQQVPAGHQQVPAGQQQMPGGQQLMPVGQQQVPAGQQQMPAGQQQVNMQYQQVPPQNLQAAAQNQVPVPNQQVPVANQQIPAANQQVPVANQQVPVSNHQVPVANQQVPVANQQVPVAKS